MGGFWQSAPRMGGFGLAFAAAAFGLPGLANFVGEFLSLVGAFQVFPIMVVFASLGLIGSAIYGMLLFQKTFQGESSKPIQDLSVREIFICSSLLGLLIVLGLYPNIILRYAFGVLA
jgi:NADH-quinone oxidoreductase subunit M